ncbi:DUF485 domain-containing protein [Actinophytocola gossypii]|uniref:DUF485 domain-containing protein n=1 Tax=Actinophytocola gossypii TaxID=2812003 RepID=A0ABT2JBW1_9PSEU|nr:DUF485 domain-containing protein [Actinophytocola gossypii]MCT2585352.1 DUF485 domain-containing protein [Actinophytocola gossypii]
MTQVVRPRIASSRPSPGNNPGRNPGSDFGGITRQSSAASSGPPGQKATDFTAIQKSPEFTALRRRFRGFVFPMTALFFLWYLTYVLLAAFARDFMAHRLVGSVNVGLVLGLLQFASTLAITFAYVRYARRRLDPQVGAIRSEVGR